MINTEIPNSQVVLGATRELIAGDGSTGGRGDRYIRGARLS